MITKHKCKITYIARCTEQDLILVEITKSYISDESHYYERLEYFDKFNNDNIEETEEDYISNTIEHISTMSYIKEIKKIVTTAN